MNLEPKHWILLSAFLGLLGGQISGLKHGWGDALDPTFLGATLGQLGVMIGAIYVGAPGATQKLAQANLNTDMANESVRAALDPPPDPAKLDPKRFLGPDVKEQV